MKKICLTTLTVIGIMGLSQTANARPVSYPTGWTVMQMNDGDSNSLHIHYSPTAQYSIGFKSEYWRDEEWAFNGVQVNALLKRWNMPAAQANIYLKTGAGVATSSYGAFDHETEMAAFSGIAADWENRRFFVSYENRGTHAGDIAKGFRQKARVGIAPYIGDYGDVHTWLMLQVDHNPISDDEEVVFTPMVRMFKNEYLGEVGMSHTGDVMFNVVVRF